MKHEKRFTTISIPVQLNERIKEKIEGTGFHSVSSYVTYVLRQLVSDAPRKESEEGQTFTKEEEEQVEDRLRGLGYLE